MAIAILPKWSSTAVYDKGKSTVEGSDNIHSNTFNGVQVEDDEGSERWWCRARAPSSAHDNKECGVFVCAGHCG